MCQELQIVSCSVLDYLSRFIKVHLKTNLPVAVMEHERMSQYFPFPLHAHTSVSVSQRTFILQLRVCRWSVPLLVTSHCLIVSPEMGGSCLIHFFSFLKTMYLFIQFGLHQVPVVAWGLLLQRRGSGVAAHRISSCGPPAQLPHSTWVPSSPTRGQTDVPCAGRWTVSYGATKEVPPYSCYSL